MSESKLILKYIADRINDSRESEKFLLELLDKVRNNPGSNLHYYERLNRIAIEIDTLTNIRISILNHFGE